jgi:hypothetical protein
METKEFATASVLSTITGRLVSDIGAVYEVCNWMTGESVFTHQLPRIGREARPVIVAAHPQIQQALDEAENVTTDNWRQWLQTWEDRYGPTISVPKFTAETHESIDPLSELAEKVHPDRIIPVVVAPSSDGKEMTDPFQHQKS